MPYISWLELFQNVSVCKEFSASQVQNLQQWNILYFSATTKDYVQYNTLNIEGWSTTKDITAIKCKYIYDITKYEYETSTKFSFKGKPIIERCPITVSHYAYILLYRFTIFSTQLIDRPMNWSSW
jgi:hypothetical protein